MRLTYIGAQPTTFIGVGALEPGTEFEVPDDEAARWLCRADVEEAPDTAPSPAPAVKPRKAPKAPASTTTDAAPAAPDEEKSGAVPDDH